VVHRDVSPQNILVGTDGVARVLDFGVAKAAARVQVTRDGQMKGKLSYMSPEQLSGASVDRRCDVFAAGVVLWEALTGERLFTGEDVSDVLTKIVRDPVPPPSTVNPRVRGSLDQVVMRALDKNPETRFQTARDFAVALEESTDLMSSRSVGEWVERIARPKGGC
jgi:serine/threonine-protein kinase